MARYDKAEHITLDAGRIVKLGVCRRFLLIVFHELFPGHHNLSDVSLLAFLLHLFCIARWYNTVIFVNFPNVYVTLNYMFFKGHVLAI